MFIGNACLQLTAVCGSVLLAVNAWSVILRAACCPKNPPLAEIGFTETAWKKERVLLCLHSMNTGEDTDFNEEKSRNTELHMGGLRDLFQNTGAGSGLE